MSSEKTPTPPSVSWAQRYACVYLNFNVECEKPDIKIEEKMVSFKGFSNPDQKMYEVEIPLYGEINPKKSTHVNKGRLIELVLCKNQPDEAYWPSLTSDNKKHHWLRVDFNRWQDEEDSGSELEENYDMFSNKIGDYGDEYENDESSSNEEEDLPDVPAS